MCTCVCVYVYTYTHILISFIYIYIIKISSRVNSTDDSADQGPSVQYMICKMQFIFWVVGW